MRSLIKKHITREALVSFSFSFVVAILYFLICYKYLFSVTAASDPLQYVGPALKPDDGFAFMDRLLLWYWIRLISHLPIAREHIGGVSTLIAMSSILFAGSFWLAQKKNIYSVLLFVVLFVFNPILIGNSSYTYPTQLLALVLAFTTLMVLSAKKQNNRLLIGGIGYAISMFAKIQAWSYIFFLIYLIFKNDKSDYLKDILRLGAGVFIGLFTVVLLVAAVDGPTMIVTLYEQYFEGGVFSIQQAGRALGGVPPFYLILTEPTLSMGLVMSIYALHKKDDYYSEGISVAALSQLTGLIAIYLITQRGGPILSNYLIDFSVLSAFVVSIVLGDYIFSYINSRNIGFRVQVAGAIVCVAVLYVTLFGVIAVTDLMYSIWYSFHIPIENVYLLSALIAFWVLLAGGIFLLVFDRKYQKSVVATILAIVILIIPFSRSGVRDANFKREYWVPAYDVSKKLSVFPLHDKIWVNVKLNNVNHKTGSERVKRIYDTFYSRSGGTPQVHFGTESVKFDYLITDDTNLSSRLENSYGHQKGLFYEYSFRRKKSKVWILSGGHSEETL